MIRRDQLQARIELLECSVRTLQEALDELAKNELVCLEHFYISGERYAIARLELELQYSPAQLYRIRDHAIENLACLLYGSA